MAVSPYSNFVVVVVVVVSSSSCSSSSSTSISILPFSALAVVVVPTDCFVVGIVVILERWEWLYSSSSSSSSLSSILERGVSWRGRWRLHLVWTNERVLYRRCSFRACNCCRVPVICWYCKTIVRFFVGLWLWLWLFVLVVFGGNNEEVVEVLLPWVIQSWSSGCNIVKVRRGNRRRRVGLLLSCATRIATVSSPA